MTSCNHMYYQYCNGSQESFLTRQCSDSYGKGVTRLSSQRCYPSLACPIPRFVSNRAYLGSFGTDSGEDRITAHLDECFAINDLDLIVKKYWKTALSFSI
ncbi:hypothetical protein TNCV_1227611 [Trichonephila clavipes]|nr:hypothetical protein TNCV_1227611 [Trichonephila clavipes]